MNRRRFETIAFIETTCPLVFGVDKNRANTDNFGGLKCSQKGISQQTPANLFPLMLKIDSQPGQNHHRNRMPRQTLPDARGRVAVIHRPHGQAVIAADPEPLTNNIGLRCIGPLILQCITPQAIVQKGMTAIETTAIMQFRKQNRGSTGGR